MVLFAELRREDFALIHEPIDEVELDAGQHLYQADVEGRHVFTVRDGLIKLVRYLPDGTQRIVRLLRQGDVAGLEATVGEPYQHHAVVLDRAVVCRIPVSTIQNLSTHTPRLHRQLMQRWQRTVAEADAWVTELSTGPAKQRVAHLLLKLAEYSDPERLFIPSREDVGAMLGITTETASRVIADLRRQGIVERVAPGRHRVDIERLEALINP
jgi:CRP-like cAMP-binding protein